MHLPVFEMSFEFVGICQLCYFQNYSRLVMRRVMDFLPVPRIESKRFYIARQKSFLGNAFVFTRLSSFGSQI